MSKFRKRIGAALLSAMMVLVLAPTPSYAAVTTVKNIPGTTKVPTAMKKATKVKEGTMALKFKKGAGTGILKFKATETKTYTFTLSNLTSKSKTTIGMFQVNKQETKKSLKNASKVKIARVGKRPVVFIASESLVERAEKNGTIKFKSYYTPKKKAYTYKYLSETTFRIDLKKGETIFLLGQFRNNKNKPVTAKMTLTIA